MRYPYIRIWLRDQRLDFHSGPDEVIIYEVSTSKYGPGERLASECTPRGRHIVRAKIGDELNEGAVLVGRRPTGEIYSEKLAAEHPHRDWILTRILWLSGTEPGLNRFGDVDTMRRCIYIPISTPKMRSTVAKWKRRSAFSSTGMRRINQRPISATAAPKASASA